VQNITDNISEINRFEFKVTLRTIDVQCIYLMRKIIQKNFIVLFCCSVLFQFYINIYILVAVFDNLICIG
jgi:hypothetical protein